ncbi:YvrJ family protein [Heliophilum fasciatum]|uniref:YvrJ-like protein n=1 Tax=Heliophilum fasciatum TaxID=35700 RepID=A0A4R2RYL8_9FIRM|nr:YvrJ family protein [Heliophilum fasciatum]MCW2276892.1 hypothetical protein [Heliophilum fasciatum]TCP68648.1 YvrJ-like protein [Heliophilum fasciatum]
MDEQLLRSVADVGFPIAIASYLLIRFEPLIKGLENTIHMLTLIIAKQQDLNIEEVKPLIKGVNG